MKKRLFITLLHLESLVLARLAMIIQTGID
jgi:hypothetical protein